MVIIMFNARTRSSNEVLEDVRKHYYKNLFKTVIPRNVTVRDSTIVGSNAVRYDENASASRAYVKLASELEKTLMVK